MSKEIDWSKAPAGATHARKNYSGFDWYKRENGIWMYLSPADVWERAYFISEADCEERPKWTGQGLPPIGAVCDMQDDLGEWVTVEIIAVHAGYAHGWHKPSETAYFSNIKCEFRPIRTPEQIAAEEREKAIQRMVKDCRPMNRRAVCEDLYDAGYRRVEPK